MRRLLRPNPAGWVLRGILVCAVVAAAHHLGRTRYQSWAPYLTEEAASEKARQLDIGHAALLGERQFTVDSHGEVHLRFTVGAAGMAPGGGLRIGTAHSFGWEQWGGVQLQTNDPGKENFLSWSASSGAKLRWKGYGGVGPNPLFAQYHPWQNINEFILEGEALKPGDLIDIRIGDRSQGSPGVRMQPSDEEAFVLKFYVDSFGEGDFLPLPENPSLRFVSGPPKLLHVSAASSWVAGEPGWVNLWVDDGFGNPAGTYDGEVQLTGLPGDGPALSHRFNKADRGGYRFTDLRLSTPGTYRIQVRDAARGWTAESNPFRVHASAPPRRTYWGDLHSHTAFSDGRGLPAEMYDFARRAAALDFCAVTDHAFTVTDRMWEQSKETTNRLNDPGAFVTLLAYEWSGVTDVGGDHNIFTDLDDLPIIRSLSYYNYRNLRMYHGGPALLANHIEEVFRLLNDRFDDGHVLAIPHYGGRRGNAAWHNPKIQRAIEIFSDHRRSEDWAADFFQSGYRLGMIASTDNHSGNSGFGMRREERTVGVDGPLFSRFSPKEAGTSLVAVQAERLDRESIFRNLYNRATYATTGSRILLDFTVNGFPMGSEIRAPGDVALAVTVEGTAGIQAVRLVKNGEILHTTAGSGNSAQVQFSDQLDSARAWYYVDVVQTDGEKAVSSPVWVNWGRDIEGGSQAARQLSQ